MDSSADPCLFNKCQKILKNLNFLQLNPDVCLVLSDRFQFTVKYKKEKQQIITFQRLKQRSFGIFVT